VLNGEYVCKSDPEEPGVIDVVLLKGDFGTCEKRGRIWNLLVQNSTGQDERMNDTHLTMVYPVKARKAGQG